MVGDTMLKRKISEKLLAWKNNADKKCLIVEGARQVGKTYSIMQFAQAYYKEENTIIINFLKDSDAHKIFDGNLDEESITKGFQILFRDKKIIEGKSLIFLDEIQNCPRAITSLKFLNESGKYDVIASGSLLGVSYATVESFPVGYVERIIMHSLDFEEFLWSQAIETETIQLIKTCFEQLKPVPEIVHSQLMKIFTLYIVTGGMPEVVDQYTKNNDFNEVLSIQQRIVNDYKDDIAKYASKSEKIRARECFESIPRQLAKDYKKFQYKTVAPGSRSNMYTSSIQWLIDAGIINKCSNLVIPQIPLIANSKVDSFKIYIKDTGLLMGMLGPETQKKVLLGELGTFNGGIFENVVGDLLVKAGKNLYYFERNSTLEVDFIMEYRNEIAAIEVKSGDNTKSKSLNSILEFKTVKYGIRLSIKNVSHTENLSRIPLYMTMFL